MGFTHTDCRLHQILFADRDYEGSEVDWPASLKPHVVSVRSKDQAKLLYDVVCTLTDMQYVVFHATISSDGPYASQEYFIRHMDGCTLDTKGEKERVLKYLEAAIRRRVCEVSQIIWLYTFLSFE